MRAFTFSLVAIFMVAGLAMPVNAEPEPPGNCAEWTKGVGLVDVSLRRNCSFLVEVDTTPCAPPSTSSTSRNIGAHTVRVTVCDGGGLPPISAAQASPCGDTLYMGVIGQAGTDTDCNASVHLIDTYRLCRQPLAGVGDDRAGAYVGDNQVSAGYCYPEMDMNSNDVQDPFVVCVTSPCGPSLPGTPDPTRACKPLSYAVGSSTISVASDCHVTVSQKTYDCVWNGHWHSETYGGLVTYRYYHCDVHDETEAQDPTVTCVRECGPTVDLKNLCKPIVYGPVSIAANCHVTVTADYMSCIWNGQWTRKTVGPVTAEVYTCNGRPPTTTSAAARPCPVTGIDEAGIVVATRDCDLYLKLSDCILGGNYVPVTTVGPTTVYVFSCFAGADPTQSNDGPVVISGPRGDCPGGSGYWVQHTPAPVIVRTWKCGTPPS